MALRGVSVLSWPPHVKSQSSLFRTYFCYFSWQYCHLCCVSSQNVPWGLEPHSIFVSSETKPSCAIYSYSHIHPFHSWQAPVLVCFPSLYFCPLKNGNDRLTPQHLSWQRMLSRSYIDTILTPSLSKFESCSKRMLGEVGSAPSLGVFKQRKCLQGYWKVGDTSTVLFMICIMYKGTIE